MVDDEHNEGQNAAQRARAVRAKDVEKENEERRLADLLFGGGGGTVEQPDLTKHEPIPTSIDKSDLHGTPLFEINRTTTSALPPIDSNSNYPPPPHSNSSSC